MLVELTSEQVGVLARGKTHAKRMHNAWKSHGERMENACESVQRKNRHPETCRACF